ncbi:hypothetical protein BSLG_003395 [Batrachochytrium salamandrivorans]|nr:hypothetical protein BSLG_003395 [Batrachochytrium salamandrivorans]
MPILLKEYTFSQNELELFVSVPLGGANASKVDVYCNDVYIKINFAPFFFELDLNGTIDPEISVASVGNGVVTFTLVKSTLGIWDTIKFQAESPKALRDRRSDAEQRQRDLAIKKREQAVLAKRTEERDLIHRQIEVERAKRDRVEALKQAEKDAVGSSIESWTASTLKLESTRKSEPPSYAHLKEPDVISPLLPATEPSLAITQCTVRTDSAIFSTVDHVQHTSTLDDLNASVSDVEDEDIDVEAIRDRVRKTLKARVEPPPRPSQDITVTFTRRGHIPTSTARETEDEKWLLRIKLAEALHKSKKRNENQSQIQEDDNNPAFLKDKGSVFFKQGNLESAFNAFTSAIDLDPVNSSLYANRAACHLQLGKGAECVSDCTAALSLLTKEDDMLREQLIDPVANDHGNNSVRNKLRIKLFARRGAAKLTLLGDVRGALSDYRDALALDPTNLEVEMDVKAIAKQVDDIIDDE